AEPTWPADPWLGDWAAAFAASRPGQNAREVLRDAARLTETLPGAVIRSAEVCAAISRLLVESRDPSGGWARPGPDLETTAVAVGLGGTVTADAPAAAFLRSTEDPALGYR